MRRGYFQCDRIMDVPGDAEGISKRGTGTRIQSEDENSAFHRKRNYIPLLPTTPSFLMMRTMEVQDRADIRTCLD